MCRTGASPPPLPHLPHRSTCPPAASERPAAAVVDGQLVVLSSVLPSPAAQSRWPSVHICQFRAQYARDAEYLDKPSPPCRWRACLLPNAQLQARHTLVGGESSVYAVSQSCGVGMPIDGVSRADVYGSASFKPPTSLVPLECAELDDDFAIFPSVVDGFVLLHTPGVDKVRDSNPNPNPNPNPNAGRGQGARL